jgi:hypothetical protein
MRRAQFFLLLVLSSLLLLSSLLTSGCYLSYGLSGADGGVELDAGTVDAAILDGGRDAGPLPSCDELFRRTPDVLSELPYVDFTCTPTTLPLAGTSLEVWGAGGEPIVRSCFRVASTYATSGWTVGQVVSADGPGVVVRVAGPSNEPGNERVVWEVRALDAAGLVIGAGAEALRIERATETAYGDRVEGLASIDPSLWASPGQVNAGLYGHPTSDGSSLQLASLGATWLSDGPRTLFSWVYPDDQVRSIEVPGVTPLAHVVEWLDADGEHWRIVERNRMISLRAAASATGPIVLEGTMTLADLGEASEIALDGARLLVQDAVTLYAFNASDGSPLGIVATDVPFLLPTAAWHNGMRLEVFGTAGEDRPFSLDDFRLVGGLLGYAGDGLIVGQLGVLGSTDVPGPRFAPFENLGISGRARMGSPVATGAHADVLYTAADGSDRAQRLTMSFRGCD